MSRGFFELVFELAVEDVPGLSVFDGGFGMVVDGVHKDLQGIVPEDGIDVIPCDEEEVFGASELVLLRGDLGDELLDLVDEKFLLCACIVWGFEAGQDLCGLVGGERQGVLHREDMPVEF